MEILELVVRAGDVEVGRTLLSAVAGQSGRRMRANLPPSLRGLLFPDERELVEEFGLMGRVIDLKVLAAALEPVWLRRIKTSGNRGGSFRLSTGAGTAAVWASVSGIRVDRRGTGGRAISVDERAFAHLSSAASTPLPASVSVSAETPPCCGCSSPSKTLSCDGRTSFRMARSPTPMASHRGTRHAGLDGSGE